MKKIDIDNPALLESLTLALGSGEIVMHPTETCYGLAVDVFNQAALERLYRVKKMPFEKPLSILVDNFEMAEKYGQFSVFAKKLAQRFWPGPLSIVVPRTEILPSFFNPGHKFVSIRCSSFDLCQEMVRSFGGPLTTTSANFSGEPELYGPDVLDGVDLLVDAGFLEENAPSTIVQVMDGGYLVLREGGVALSDIEEMKN